MNDITLATATLAGGCFWCIEAIFKRLKGVVAVTSGYAGGQMENPDYEAVTTGETGHAEAIQIEFDPAIITYGKLLDVFWATHDPTSLNRQGSDVGTQYRSAIFYEGEEQKTVALESKAKAEREDLIGRDIVTEISPLGKFYTAESYHQNYYDLNKNSNPYCSIVINPKIEKLLQKFNQQVKDEYRDKSI